MSKSNNPFGISKEQWEHLTQGMATNVLLRGAVGGISQPVDTVRSFLVKNPTFTYDDAWQAKYRPAFAVSPMEGLKEMWRGGGAAQVRFALRETLFRTPAMLLANHLFNGRKDFAAQAGSAAIVAVTDCVGGHPLETIKNRVSAGAATGKKISYLQAVKQGSLYTGVKETGYQSGLQFFTVYAGRPLIEGWMREHVWSIDGKQKLTYGQELAVSSEVGAAAGLVTLIPNTIKTAKQVAGSEMAGKSFAEKVGGSMRLGSLARTAPLRLGYATFAITARAEMVRMMLESGDKLRSSQSEAKGRT